LPPLPASAGIAVLLTSLASASQPEVKLADLREAQVLDVLLMDPYAATEMTVALPEGFATLDVDADPFADAI
jgi:hypothetical protein